MDKFARNVLNELVFKVGSDEFKVKPQMKAKVELMQGLAASKDNSSRLNYLAEFICKLFVENNPDVDKKVIEEFVYSNIGELQEQLMLGFRLINKSELDAQKKQISQQTDQN